MSVEAVRKWHALAERRRRHYSEEAFAMLMRDVIQNVESWNRVLEEMTGRAAAKAA